MAHATGKPAVADDSGIAAAALGGRPGVRSARYAGEHATDEDNLAKLLEEVPDDGDRRVAYVCALAYVDGHEELVVEGRCEGMLASEPRGSGGFGYDPAFVPADDDRAHDGRALAGREGRDQPPRPRGPGAAREASGDEVSAALAGAGDRPGRAVASEDARRRRVDPLERHPDRAQDRGRHRSPARSRSSPRRSTRGSTWWPRSWPTSRSARPTSRPTRTTPTATRRSRTWRRRSRAC